MPGPNHATKPPPQPRHTFRIGSKNFRIGRRTCPGRFAHWGLVHHHQSKRPRTHPALMRSTRCGCRASKIPRARYHRQSGLSRTTNPDHIQLSDTKRCVTSFRLFSEAPTTWTSPWPDATNRYQRWYPVEAACHRFSGHLLRRWEGLENHLPPCSPGPDPYQSHDRHGR